MINEETRRKLREMCLEDMITAIDLQDSDLAYSSLPFDDRMKLLVDYTYQEKYNDKVKRLLSQVMLAAGWTSLYCSHWAPVSSFARSATSCFRDSPEVARVILPAASESKPANKESERATYACRIC